MSEHDFFWSMNPDARAKFIDDAINGTGEVEWNEDAREALLFGYVIGLSVALADDKPYTKAEFAKRREQLDQMRGTG